MGGLWGGVKKGVGGTGGRCTFTQLSSLSFLSLSHPLNTLSINIPTLHHHPLPQKQMKKSTTLAITPLTSRSFFYVLTNPRTSLRNLGRRCLEGLTRYLGLPSTVHSRFSGFAGNPNLF